MRYPASEKLEIIRLVEQSHLPVRRTLEKLGIAGDRYFEVIEGLDGGEIVIAGPYAAVRDLEAGSSVRTPQVPEPAETTQEET